MNQRLDICIGKGPKHCIDFVVIETIGMGVIADRSGDSQDINAKVVNGSLVKVIDRKHHIMVPVAPGAKVGEVLVIKLQRGGN